jgi:hypothetical protein
VLVPGVDDTPARLAPLKTCIEQEGMRAHVFEYPAREWTIDRASLTLATFVERDVLGGAATHSVSFVGFGTGSLVERFYLTHYEILPARRCIIVADPQHPSDKYRTHKAGWLGRRRYGALLQQLAEGPLGFASRCGQPPIPYGVIVTATVLAPAMDKRDNQVVANSLYTPPALLTGARDVAYVATKCDRYARDAAAMTLITTFLQHGWFTQQ